MGRFGETLADPIDVHIDGAVNASEIRSPDCVEKLIAAERDAGRSREFEQQLELFGWDGGLAAGPANFVSALVEDDVASLDKNLTRYRTIGYAIRLPAP